MGDGGLRGDRRGFMTGLGDVARRSLKAIKHLENSVCEISLHYGMIFQGYPDRSIKPRLFDEIFTQTAILVQVVNVEGLV